MKRGQSKMWWLVACTSRRGLRTDSQKDVEEIVKSKLSTILEEPELQDQDESMATTKHRQSRLFRFKMSKLSLVSNFKDSYIHFMAEFMAKGSLTVGIPVH
ncbi:hypothetical protein Nepgr_025811 [Nepenthes gracilis]|uniref:Uncharacterized protein n=1 Tax=Nepenthes gracilis TaxID=150966 RepID=A0AAD3Y013_NEPGR|nr:hypothetical protein Nepgr_025811 [Nepenthes gracilis]